MLWDLSRSPSSDTLGVNSASLPPPGPLRHHPAWGLSRTDSVYGAYNDDHIYFANSNIGGTTRTAKYTSGMRGYGEMPPACISTAHGLPDNSPGMFSSSVLMLSLARPPSPPPAPTAASTARRYNAPSIFSPSYRRQNSSHSGSGRRFNDAGTLPNAGNLDGAGWLGGDAGLSVSSNNSNSHERASHAHDSTDANPHEYRDDDDADGRAPAFHGASSRHQHPRHEHRGVANVGSATGRGQRQTDRGGSSAGCFAAIDNMLAEEDAEKMPVFFAAAGDNLVASVVQTGNASGHEVVGGSSTTSGRDSHGVGGGGIGHEVYPSGFVGPSGKAIPGGSGRRSTGSGGVVIRSAAVLPLRRLVLLGCSDGWVRLSI